MPVYTLSYHFKVHPQQHQLQLQQPELTPADAPLHLLELHLGAAENSLTQPAADASARAEPTAGSSRFQVDWTTENGPSSSASACRTTAAWCGPDVDSPTLICSRSRSSVSAASRAASVSAGLSGVTL